MADWLLYSLEMPSISILVLRTSFLRWVLIYLISAQAILVGFDVLFNYQDATGYMQIRRIFNIAREGSIPSCFSALQLLLISMVAFFMRFGGFKLSRKKRLLWGLVGCLFLFLALDDSAEIHERLGSVFKIYAESARERGEQTWWLTLQQNFPSYEWQIVVLPFFILTGAIVFAGLLTELRDNRGRLLFASGLVCFVLAIGIDFYEGLDGALYDLADRWQQPQYFVSHLAKLVEECFEMLGATLILLCFLRHAIGQLDELRISFDDN